MFLLNCYLGKSDKYRLALESRYTPGTVVSRANFNLWIIKLSPLATQMESKQYFWIKDHTKFRPPRDLENGVMIKLHVMGANEIHDARPEHTWDDKNKVFHLSNDDLGAWRGGFRFIVPGAVSKGANDLELFVSIAVFFGEVLCYITENRSTWDDLFSEPWMEDDIVSPFAKVLQLVFGDSKPMKILSLLKREASWIHHKWPAFIVTAGSEEVEGQRVFVVHVGHLESLVTRLKQRIQSIGQAIENLEW